MQLGMIGLGRMGGNMAKRLDEHGHDIKTYDPKVESTAPFGRSRMIVASPSRLGGTLAVPPPTRMRPSGCTVTAHAREPFVPSVTTPDPPAASSASSCQW